MGIPSGVGSRGDRQGNPGRAPAPAPLTLRTLVIPVGEARELPGLSVRELPERHGWSAWDVAEAMLDFAPTQALGLDGEGA